MPAAEPRSRERILHYLKTKGPRTAGQIAARFRFTAVAARQHLQSLESEGLVSGVSESREPGRRVAGRPAQLWRLTEKANSRFPDSHADLALGMIEAARAAFGPDGLALLVRERTAALERQYAEELSAADSLGERVKMLAAIREREGYMAAWVREGEGRYMLIENHCPICAAAASCTGICDGELELFERVLGRGVSVKRTEHIISGASRCVYEIVDTDAVGRA